MIRKGVRPEHVTADLYSNPLIWDYARQAGFTTYLIDAQREGKGHNHFDSLELRLVDHNIKTRHIAWDLEIPALMSHLQAPGKSLTLVIMRGSHFPYKRNFPPDYSLEVRSSVCGS